MKILLDADGSPVRQETVSLAQEHQIPLYIISNINHMIEEPYGEILTVDHDKDAADFKILSLIEPGDLVITQDYGLASLVLAKEAHAMHHDGWFYTNFNMEALLMRRHLNAKARKKGNRPPSTKKRTELQNVKFKHSLEQFILDKGAI